MELCWLTVHNSEKNFILVRSMQLRMADRLGLEHYPFIILDFKRGLAFFFFSRIPEGRRIATNILQEIAVLPSREAVYMYMSQHD